MAMKSANRNNLPGNSAADKKALLEKQEEIQEKRKNKIVRFKKAANARQQLIAAALEASDVDWLKDPKADAKARKIISKLPDVSFAWDEENREMSFVCDLLFADFLSGKLQYGTKKSIEISAEVKPMKMLKLLMQKQPNAVTYQELSQELSLLTKEMKTDLPAHKRFGRQIQDVRGDLGAVLRDAGMSEKEIESMIITKPKHGFALRCG